MKLATFVLSFFLTSVFYSFANAAVSQWTDFTLDNGHVFFPVNIEGIPTRVMLDSGAQINSINKAWNSFLNNVCDRKKLIEPLIGGNK